MGASLDRAERSVEEQSNALKKPLGLGDLVLTQIVFVVGSGWVGTAAKLGTSHLFFWLLAILLFYIPQAAVVIYLSRLMPLEGGIYQWAKLAFNEFTGFIVAWNLWLLSIMVIAMGGMFITTNISYALGEAAAWMRNSPWCVSLVSLGLVGGLGWTGLRGLSLGKWVHMMLPVTLLMLVLSARAGALAQRIGPRWPMVVGTAVAAAGILLLSRVGPGASYLTDVLPGAALFGLGISAVVAPLTATVLASADVRLAGVASGVNNAVARTAQLLAVAGLPLAVGLSGSDYRDPAVFDGGFRLAMFVCAGLLLAGSALSLVAISDDTLATTPARPTVPRPLRHVYCAVDGPPLETDGAPVETTGDAGRR